MNVTDTVFRKLKWKDTKPIWKRIPVQENEPQTLLMSRPIKRWEWTLIDTNPTHLSRKVFSNLGWQFVLLKNKPLQCCLSFCGLFRATKEKGDFPWIEEKLQVGENYSLKKDGNTEGTHNPKCKWRRVLFSTEGIKDIRYTPTRG